MTGASSLDIRNGLNYRHNTDYMLTITARDLGDPVQSSKATVCVTVINTNDNPHSRVSRRAVRARDYTAYGHYDHLSYRLRLTTILRH